MSGIMHYLIAYLILGIIFHFWCPVPVYVRTSEQSYRETRANVWCPVQRLWPLVSVSSMVLVYMYVKFIIILWLPESLTLRAAPMIKLTSHRFGHTSQYRSLSYRYVVLYPTPVPVSGHCLFILFPLSYVTRFGP